MTAVDVDVVILSWNRVEGTIAAVTSACRQEDVSLHVWVVDQGSDPAQLARLHRQVGTWAEVTIIENGSNLGAPGGRNVGFRSGAAPMIACIDNDVELFNPGALRAAQEAFAARPELAAVGFRVAAVADGVELDYNWPYPDALRERADEAFDTVRFLAGGVAFRRSAIEAVGWYDARLFFTWEETDLAYRLINAGHTLAYSPAAQAIHRVADESRVTWRESRFYYHMRNALFIDYKYWHSPVRLVTRAVGYLLRGCYNRVPGQAVRALAGFLELWWLARPSPADRLNARARAYIYEHHGRFEPPLPRRIVEKLFAGFSTN